MNFNRHDFANKLREANKRQIVESLNESNSNIINEDVITIVNEGKFAEWEVSFKAMNLGGTKLHPKNVYKVKARNTVEAIKKAAKKAGVKDNYWHATETNFLNKINEAELNEGANDRSDYDKTDGPIITDIKAALKNGKVNVGSMVEVSVNSNNKNLPDGEYAIMPMTDMGDYWKVGDLKRFADKVIDDLKGKLKGKYEVELVKVDTGKSIRSWIVKVTK